MHFLKSCKKIHQMLKVFIIKWLDYEWLFFKFFACSVIVLFLKLKNFLIKKEIKKIFLIKKEI